MDFLSSTFDSMLSADQGPPADGPRAVLLVLLLAFVLGHVVAWVYMWTHAGLSYSRTFAASLLVLPLLVALFMMLVASNAFVALGMLAVFTMIRFRNVLKDTRDTMFILWALVEGLSVGTQHFGLALAAALGTALVFLYAWVSHFGTRDRYDVIVSLEWAGGHAATGTLRDLLHRHAARVQLALQRELEGDRLDVSYRLLLRDPARTRELMAELQATPGVQRPSLYHREDEAEL
ncbi:MAG TPA: DUF4956 domain-containing protein [Humisphaera sp.]